MPLSWKALWLNGWGPVDTLTVEGDGSQSFDEATAEAFVVTFLAVFSQDEATAEGMLASFLGSQDLSVDATADADTSSAAGSQSISAADADAQSSSGSGSQLVASEATAEADQQSALAQQSLSIEATSEADALSATGQQTLGVDATADTGSTSGTGTNTAGDATAETPTSTGVESDSLSVEATAEADFSSSTSSQALSDTSVEGESNTGTGSQSSGEAVAETDTSSASSAQSISPDATADADDTSGTGTPAVSDAVAEQSSSQETGSESLVEALADTETSSAASTQSLASAEVDSGTNTGTGTHSYGDATADTDGMAGTGSQSLGESLSISDSLANTATGTQSMDEAIVEQLTSSARMAWGTDFVFNFDGRDGYTTALHQRLRDPFTATSFGGPRAYVENGHAVLENVSSGGSDFIDFECTRLLSREVGTKWVLDVDLSDSWGDVQFAFRTISSGGGSAGFSIAQYDSTLDSTTLGFQVIPGHPDILEAVDRDDTLLSRARIDGVWYEEITDTSAFPISAYEFSSFGVSSTGTPASSGKIYIERVAHEDVTFDPRMFEAEADSPQNSALVQRGPFETFDEATLEELLARGWFYQGTPVLGGGVIAWDFTDPNTISPALWTYTGPELSPGVGFGEVTLWLGDYELTSGTTGFTINQYWAGVNYAINVLVDGSYTLSVSDPFNGSFPEMLLSGKPDAIRLAWDFDTFDIDIYVRIAGVWEHALNDPGALAPDVRPLFEIDVYPIGNDDLFSFAIDQVDAGHAQDFIDETIADELSTSAESTQSADDNSFLGAVDRLVSTGSGSESLAEALAEGHGNSGTGSQSETGDTDDMLVSASSSQSLDESIVTPTPPEPPPTPVTPGYEQDIRSIVPILKPRRPPRRYKRYPVREELYAGAESSQSLGEQIITIERTTAASAAVGVAVPGPTLPTVPETTTVQAMMERTHRRRAMEDELLMLGLL